MYLRPFRLSAGKQTVIEACWGDGMLQEWQVEVTAKVKGKEWKQ